MSHVRHHETRALQIGQDLRSVHTSWWLLPPRKKQTLSKRKCYIKLFPPATLGIYRCWYIWPSAERDNCKSVHLSPMGSLQKVIIDFLIENHCAPCCIYLLWKLGAANLDIRFSSYQHWSVVCKIYFETLYTFLEVKNFTTLAYYSRTNRKK